MNDDDFKIELYRKSIQSGINRPYDKSEDGEAPKPLTPERTAAYAVLDNLLDRRGIKWALEDVDLDIREEIVDTLAGIIKEAMK